ncbi:hypothetical protein [Streptomyces sp. NPDC023327]|uniref:hypothetical protein n=1 Tax=Streptomyces sp. NPDC023327 TaxID=3157088 RepID=UPI0033D7C703
MTTTPHYADGPHQHIHRFALLGRDKLFLHHLSLYKQTSGHQYQAVLAPSFQEELRKKYLESLDGNKDKRVFHTVKVTKHFPLPELNREEGKTFHVTLERVTVQDNGEREFVTILATPTEVVCKKKDVLYFKQLHLDRPPYPENLTYLIFGHGKEIHLSHKLAMHENWDEALTVTLAKSNEMFRTSQTFLLENLTIEKMKDPKKKVTQSPLKPGQEYRGALNGIGGFNTSFTFVVGRQAWWNHTTLNDL